MEVDCKKGVMNGPLKFLTARKILHLLDLLAKFKRLLACSCSPNFCSCSQARKANFLFLLVLAKKSQCSVCSRMLTKTIRHTSKTTLRCGTQFRLRVSIFPMKDICKCLFMQEEIHKLKSCIVGIITHVGP